MRAAWDRFVNQNSHSSWMRRIARNADRFLKHFWNESNWDFASNGEGRVVRILSAAWAGQKVRVFDVGANRGEWSAMILDRFPDVEIHSFEIVPDTFVRLEQALAGRSSANQKVRLNRLGLSDRAGEVEVSYFPDVDNGSSIAPLPHGIRTELRTARIQKGDAYTLELGIGQIDLLKVDTEGHDLAVLQGMRQMLESGAISCIQFEYGHVCVPARVFLGDFYALLKPLGYQIGRLFPDGVAFKEYSLFHDEHFRAGNYIAVKSEHGDLIQALSRTR
jgi:FkbM family methyltransferase